MITAILDTALVGMSVEHPPVQPGSGLPGFFGSSGADGTSFPPSPLTVARFEILSTLVRSAATFTTKL